LTPLGMVTMWSAKDKSFPEIPDPSDPCNVHKISVNR
jgi:hypothetical protein